MKITKSGHYTLKLCFPLGLTNFRCAFGTAKSWRLDSLWLRTHFSPSAALKHIFLWCFSRSTQPCRKYVAYFYALFLPWPSGVLLACVVLGLRLRNNGGDFFNIYSNLILSFLGFIPVSACFSFCVGFYLWVWFELYVLCRVCACQRPW